MDEIILSGRLKGKEHNRLKRLFDMPYKPGELAEEIGINKNQIYRVYIPAGCPHEKDNRNRLWINGKQFYEWYDKTYKKLRLGKNEVFCKTCKKGVEIINPVEHEKDGLVYITCYCPNCNRRNSKIITQKRDHDK